MSDIENKNNQENENTHTYDNGFHPKEVILKENYKFYRKGFFFKIANYLTKITTAFFVFFPKKLVWGFKVVGRKNKKHIKSSILLCNHTIPYDIFLILTSMKYKKLYITTLQSNMGFGIVSTYFRLGSAVPIPTDMNMLIKFNKQTYEAINNGSSVIFYPEAALIPFCDHIRNFMPGAFHYSYATTKKIVPMVITYHKPKGLYKITRRKKPCIHLNILEPYYMDDSIRKRDSIEKARLDLEKIMSDYFIKHSDYYYDENGNKLEK